MNRHGIQTSAPALSCSVFRARPIDAMQTEQKPPDTVGEVGSSSGEGGEA
jgi:hypothetical protein